MVSLSLIRGGRFSVGGELFRRGRGFPGGGGIFYRGKEFSSGGSELTGLANFCRRSSVLLTWQLTIWYDTTR